MRADRLADLWRWKIVPSTAFRKADYQSLEGAMDVPRGAVRASSPGLHGGRDEPSGSLPGVRPARDTVRKMLAYSGAGLPAAESAPPPQPFDKLRMRPAPG